MKKIPFTKPYIDDKIVSKVVNTLNSGWLTTGPVVNELENLLCSTFNIKKSLCLNSWTSAAETVLKWFGVKENDEVIVPVITYSATANIVLHCNARVIMIDVNDNMNINVNKIKDLITENTKVIIPVDIGGVPCDYDSIYNLISSYEVKKLFKPSNEIQNKLGRILILSDAAHSLGSIYSDNFSCNFADLTVFSFHAVKNITSAEGGAICFNLPLPFDNNEIYNYFKLYTLHGQTKTAFDKYNSSKYNYWDYDIICAGYKYNMPDILASIALEQIKQFDKLMIIRKNIYKRYYNNLKKYKNIVFILDYNLINNSSCHLFCIRVNNIDIKKRDEILNKMFALNISMNVHFKPLQLLTLYKNLNYNITNYPKALSIYNNVMSLPLYYELSYEDVDYICENLIKTIESVGN
jgi:dTDP-4-amino-4,6-dideoxygalactose transaminase